MVTGFGTEIVAATAYVPALTRISSSLRAAAAMALVSDIGLAQLRPSPSVSSESAVTRKRAAILKEAEADSPAHEVPDLPVAVSTAVP